jgi:HSP20 family protein
MQQSMFYKPDSTIYPGQFVPCPDEDYEILKDINTNKSLAEDTQVNITELPESFKVEFTIPNVSRDQLIIETHSNLISVIVLHKKKDRISMEKLKKNKSVKKTSNQTVPIPKNADVEFISAEYKDGILSIYIPKSKKPHRNIHQRIIAY